MKVVVIGGGFAGINLIKSLSKDPKMEIVLVDINNYNFFPPLLYQVATAFIEPSNISYPFRRMFQEKKNLRFHLGKMVRVEPHNNTVVTDTGTLKYDYLVLGLGTETNYFGLENVRKKALPMKTVNEALLMRNHLLLNMEKAARTTDRVERDKMLNIVVAGGGPTGVEISGMLAELGRHIAAKEYPEIKDFGRHIYLIDALPVLLSPMSKKSQDEAAKVLKGLGVNVILGNAVKDYTNQEVLLANGKVIRTNSLIWTSGVIAREVPGLPEDVTARGRRLKVNEYNMVLGTENIFALGDLSFQTNDPKYPNGHPQVAQVAIQQGKLLADNLKRIRKNESLKPFIYHDKGSMAIISKYEAVADLPKMSFNGSFAWMIWLFIHIMPLVGFRNKFKLAFSWLWSFITNDPTLRLIIRPNEERRTKEEIKDEQLIQMNS